MSTKAKILKMLRQAKGPMSGEVTSREIGISRVAVHKHINRMRELGYSIDATYLGYTLAGDGDFLYPWEFEGRDGLMHFFEEVASTMDKARDMAEKGCPHMTVVAAQRQTAGRGRLQRPWHSQDGGLYFTVVLRPDMPVSQVYRALFTASACMAATLRDLFDVQAAVKWPNDILVGDRKLAGMLSELSAQGEMVQYVNLGIGINVNNDPTTAEPNAASLVGLLGREVSRKAILAGFLDRLEKSLARAGEEDVIARWKQYASTLGKPVRIETISTSLEGVAVDVDSMGNLIVELPDGSRREVSHGDCFYRSPEKPAEA